MNLKTTKINLKTFSESDLLAAKSIVAEYVKNCRSIDPNTPGFLAVPAKFHYAFSFDIDDEEEKESFIEANNNLDIDAKFENFYIFLYAIEHYTFDQHVGHLLHPFFSKNVNEEFECFLNFRFNEPTSIRDFVTLLSSQGFVYNYDTMQGSDDACILPDLMNTIEFVKS